MRINQIRINPDYSSLVQFSLKEKAQVPDETITEVFFSNVQDILVQYYLSEEDDHRDDN